MKINRIHHIAIICRNYEKSKRFYTEILGFKILKETFRSKRQSYKLDLEVAGEYQIELFSFPEPPKRLSNPESCGLRHLAFEVESIDEAVEYLNSQDIKVEETRIDETSGKKYTFFFDPDDLPLEIYEK
jgi:glyoxylase I family protein